MSLDNLIEALQIFRKYGNPEYPTLCEHDRLYIVDSEEYEISDEDMKKLNELGFFLGDVGWMSYHYGSA